MYVFDRADSNEISLEGVGLRGVLGVSAYVNSLARSGYCSFQEVISLFKT